ncbi:hypothetical protein [Psychroserpens ponticola]|uniref:SMI1/KNR4 family protein n=1 Tax=Psychroserpens ponticola TaxID=2932268 RepID=A0ABY7S374_9FLAO|nr:hypothetical protein [Psychroserpens ponticola]WCO03634.1 hypothetical protein MUN68_009005 [Psychroserpens ponticola]
MKARKRIENIENIEFLKPDLLAEIKPNFGLGGFNFNQNIKDFEQNWTYSYFEKEIKNGLNFKLDENYFYLSINTKNNEIQFDIDLFSGKLSSIICGKGYKGKLDIGVGIGSSVKDALKKDNSLGYNLDTDWIDRTPFDGLIIHVPQKLQTKCWDCASRGIELPDFEIEQIELIDLDFAKEFFEGELYFE